MKKFNLFEGLEKFGLSKKSDTIDLFNTGKSAGGQQAGEEKTINPDDFLFKRKHSCPICGFESENTVIRTSKIRYVRTDTDLRSFYEPFDPLYYDIYICTKCGYAAMSGSFASVSDRQADLISEHISPGFQIKDYPLVYSIEDSIERYKLALLNAAVKKGKNSEKAMLCLKLAWLSRDNNNEEMAQGYLENAYEGFVLAYEKENLPIYKMDENTLLYLMAEMARRLGNTDETMRYLSRVITSRTANPKLKERARDIREMVKAEKGKTE